MGHSGAAPSRVLEPRALPEGDTIGLVPCALSGKGLEVFTKSTSGTQYDWIVQRAKAAQQAGGVIDGMLFHHGESNCGDSNWPSNVKKSVQDLKTDLGLGDVPFLAGELAYGGDCSAQDPLIAQLPGLMANTFVVSASGLELDPADTQWNVHFGHDDTS